MSELHPGRYPRETFAGFRYRRATAKRHVDEYLKGQLFYESTKIVKIPPKDIDENTERSIMAGNLRDVRSINERDENGLQMRAARLKGVPYRKDKHETA